MNSNALKVDFALMMKYLEDARQFQFHMSSASLHASRMKRQHSYQILSSLHMIWRIAEVGVIEYHYVKKMKSASTVKAM